MAISCTGKVVIAVVSVLVVVGLAIAITFLVRDSDTITEDDQVPTTTPAIDYESEEETGETDDPGETTTEFTSGPDNPVDIEGYYNVGVGIADMTGPCADIRFMGYASLEQQGEGIHLRQYSRAFIFIQGETRIVLVTADVQAIGYAVRHEVVNRLQEQYGNIYTINNVILTGTHTHSAPGGHLAHFLLDVTIFGFSRETFNAYVDGITRSIIRAHENVVAAKLFYGTTTVEDAHINRSPYSYDNNPESERERYEKNTDDVLTQLRIVKENGDLHGVMNWYAVHATSMPMENKLISSDNLGYAAVLLEKHLNPDSVTGKSNIVAGFFSSNIGDVSPNTAGARCEFSGNECDNQLQLCEDDERCFAVGPGEDMFDSTRIIATKIYEGAVEIMNTEGEELTGDLAVLHQFIEMPTETVSKYNPVNKVFETSELVSGCVPALGYSFAAGTIDGANTLNFTQGLLEAIEGWQDIADQLASPTAEDLDCHAPKPILFATGRATVGYEWHPRIVSASLIWLGGLAIAGVPGEPTTMAGRRIRDVVGAVMESNQLEAKVVVSGLTNEYIHYVTTFEEYQIQRYEGASTIYGPYTLDIFLNKFNDLVTAAVQGQTVPEGPTPEDTLEDTISLIGPVLSDLPLSGMSFGDVLIQPPNTAQKGQTISASFVGASPRNNLRQEESHVTVERNENGNWVVVATDADWDTKFIWSRTSLMWATSQASFEWSVPLDAVSGTYRMVYYGANKRLVGTITEFTAITNTFTVQD